MADIILRRPNAGQRTVIPTTGEGRLVFDFSTDQATLEHQAGNLLFSFDDGARIELTDFYNNYHLGNLPEIVADGMVLDAESFLVAMGEDLVPNAAPVTLPSRTGRFDEDFASAVGESLDIREERGQEQEQLDAEGLDDAFDTPGQMLFASSGETLLVENTAGVIVHGNGGDALLVNTDATSLDSLFTDTGLVAEARDVDVLVSGDSHHVQGLADATDLARVGITLRDHNVELGTGWSQDASGNATGNFPTFSNESAGLTATVVHEVLGGQAQELAEQAARELENQG